MKNEELFEVLTDIDEELIGNALPEVLQPMEIRVDTPSRKKPRFLIPTAAAACAALVCTAVVVANVRSGNSNVFSPASAASEGAEYDELSSPSYTAEVSEPLKELSAENSAALGLEQIEFLLNSASSVDFNMPEFSDVDFSVGVGGVIVDGNNVLGESLVISVFLYDVNGDGKRDICSEVSGGTIKVYDIENGKLYAMRGNDSYTLSLNPDGDELNYVKSDFYEDIIEPLTLEDMELVEMTDDEEPDVSDNAPIVLEDVNDSDNNRL